MTEINAIVGSLVVTLANELHACIVLRCNGRFMCCFVLHGGVVGDVALASSARTSK